MAEHYRHTTRKERAEAHKRGIATLRRIVALYPHRQYELDEMLAHKPR